MADVTITYKDAEVVSISNTGLITLQTAGTYCEDNIEVDYTRPSAPDVRLVDYDGTVVASYSSDDFANLASFPANPTHQGLAEQGWNWDLLSAKAYVSEYGKLDVGQMYATNDGKTRIHISLIEGRLNPYLGLAVNGSATVDWGDGTSSIIENNSNSTVLYTPHSYTQEGDYVIEITVVSGAIYIIGNSTSSSLLLASNVPNFSGPDRFYLSSIRKIEIGSNCVVGSRAFNNCYLLRSVIIPSSVTSIGTFAFSSCNALSCVIIPSSVTSIGARAFNNCQALSCVIIPSSVTSIGAYAFNNCYDLSCVIIPPSVTSIGENAFSNCNALSCVIIPSSVTSIRSAAFMNCHTLKDPVIPSSVTSIGANAFAYCYTLKDLVIPSSVTSIDSAAFNQCRLLETAYIPSRAGTIGNSLFNGCSALKDLVIPSSVTSIGASAFMDCISLGSVVIPSSVTNIGSAAFSNCYGLSSIEFESPTPPALAYSNVFAGLPTDCVIYVPHGSIESYTTAANYPSSSKYTYIER